MTRRSSSALTTLPPTAAVATLIGILLGRSSPGRRVSIERTKGADQY